MIRRLLIIAAFVLFPLAAFAADLDEATPPPPAPTGGASTVRNQLFQVILLRAAVNGPEEIVGIPKNAEKAIRDVKDFLPFKSYRLLDSTLIRVDDQIGGKVRVDGIPPQQYDVSVAWRPVSANRLSIWNFSVMPVRQIRPGAVPLPRGVAPEADRPVIETAFAVDLGETIVVGSSKLGGDEALVVLFTALPNR